MNNVVVATISFAAGAVAGFILSNFITIEKEEKEVKKVFANDIVKKPVQNEEKPVEANNPTEVISPIHKNEDFVNRKFIEYCKIISEEDYSQNDEDEEEGNMEKEKKKGKITPIIADEWDYPSPEYQYDRQDLHYFVADDVLTDDSGNELDEEEFIGKKPRQFGWMNNDEERIYIRNNPKETDFQVWKHKCESDEWWC